MVQLEALLDADRRPEQFTASFEGPGNGSRLGASQVMKGNCPLVCMWRVCAGACGVGGDRERERETTPLMFLSPGLAWMASSINPSPRARLDLLGVCRRIELKRTYLGGLKLLIAVCTSLSVKA